MPKPDYPSEEDFLAAAWLLKCDIKAIKSVAKVESGRDGAFLNNEEDEPPVILYERHYFHKLTHGLYDGYRLSGVDKAYSYLSSKKPGGYGPVFIQHRKLQEAIEIGKTKSEPFNINQPVKLISLTRNAALMSCSWGLFQIMGANFKRCGYDDLQRFINAMYRSVQDHLRAFTMFIRSDGRLVDAIRDIERQAGTFEKYYNGPKAGGVYAKKIVKEYRLL